MPWLGTLVLSTLLQLAGTLTAGADVVLSLRDGRISIVARETSARDILAAWARAGQVKVVNLDAVPADPVTLQLEDVSEEHALTILLRKAGGYIAAPRAKAIAQGSRFDRLLIMPPGISRARIEAAEPQAHAAADDLDRGAGADQAAATAGATNHVTEPPPAADAARGEVGAARAGTYHSPAASDPAAAEEPADPAQAGRGLADLGSSRQMPVFRPLASGQMTGRRPAQGGAATGPRDLRAFARRAAGPRDDVIATDPAPAQALLPGDVSLPSQDPVAQESFKGRRPLETVDPRKFRFPIQPLPGAGVRPPAASGRQ